MWSCSESCVSWRRHSCGGSTRSLRDLDKNPEADREASAQDVSQAGTADAASADRRPPAALTAPWPARRSEGGAEFLDQRMLARQVRFRRGDRFELGERRPLQIDRCDGQDSYVLLGPWTPRRRQYSRSNSSSRSTTRPSSGEACGMRFTTAKVNRSRSS